MAEKSYYYLKLKDNFFESDEMKVLESLENGYLYSNILLKFYLKSLKNEGRLTFNEFIPYDAKMLATITGHNVDVVEKAIKVFQSMHLIEVLDNGAIYMLDIQQMIGSISSEGIRKAQYREKIKIEKESGTKLGQCPNIISISNSISNSNNNLIEEKKKEINKERKKEFEPPTLDEIKAFAREKNAPEIAQPFYEYFTAGNWIDSKGQRVKSWRQKFLTWLSFDKKEKVPKVYMQVPQQSVAIHQRTYSKNELDNLFDDIENVEI